MCKCCGTMVLATAICSALSGLAVAIWWMIALSQEDNAAVFLQIFAFNFSFGLIQAWFLLDFIKYGLQFRSGMIHCTCSIVK